MRSSVIIAALLGAVAWAAPAPTGNTEVAERSEQHDSLVTRSNYVECHQNCVRGCPAAWICQATCNVACANAGEADHEAAALTAREAVAAATKSVAVREESHVPILARSNYIECHQNCLRGCAGAWICHATCNVACANAGEAEHETAAIAAREAVKSVAVREESHAPIVARTNYVECHQNCVRGCPGAWICQATCNVACANAGEGEYETAAIVAREAVVAATNSVVVRDGLAARSNIDECQQRCVRGCAGFPGLCQPACNVACVGAGEGVADETRSLAAGEASE